MSFSVAIFPFYLRLQFNVLVLDILERPTLTCFSDTYFEVQSKEIELRGMLCLM